jgi:hypothetical protein
MSFSGEIQPSTRKKSSNSAAPSPNLARLWRSEARKLQPRALEKESKTMTVATKDLRAGMELGSDVFNVNGAKLLGSGTVLTDRHLTILQTWGIESVTVKGDHPAPDLPDQSLAGFAPEILKRAEGIVNRRFRLMSQTSGPVKTIKRLALQRVAQRLSQPK